MKAAIFDFDGTIIDTETLWYTVFHEVLMEDYKMNLPLAEFAKIIGTTDEILFRYIEKELEVAIDRELIRKKTQERFDSKKDILILREGILELIQKMKSAGLILGVASSSSRKWVEDYLDQFDIRHYFQTIKTKEDVRMVKPNPELYIKALQDLKVKPDEAIAIEDSLNGSEAAIAAGMKCVVVPNDVTEFLTFHEKVLRYRLFSEFPLEEMIKIKS